MESGPVVLGEGVLAQWTPTGVSIGEWLAVEVYVPWWL